ncbi:MAG: hypothetical protein ABFS09_10795 [Thermodesulfobacteriota bacterium]
MTLFAGLAVALLAGCQPMLHTSRSIMDGDGEVHLYVQPFPQEAQRLRFNLQALAAVKADGSLVPLPLAFSDFKESGIQRQRLLAVGPLAPGEYQGLSFLVGNAYRKSEEGEISLAVGHGPYLVEFPFQISKNKAQLLLLKFNYGRSLNAGGVVFSPAFSIFLPERLAPKVLGYVANEKSNSITIFDKGHLQVVGVIATGAGPKDIAVDRVRHRAYVPLSGEDSLALIDVSGQAIIDKARLGISDEPCESTLSPDGTLLVTSNFGSDTITLTDPASLMERARITVGDGPCAVLVDQNGRRGYVLNLWSGTISVIDLANHLVAATLAVGPEPIAGAFSPSGDRLFIVHSMSPHLEVIDTRSLAVLERVYVGSGLSDVVMDPRTEMLYFAKKSEGAVEIFDPFTLFPVDAIRVGEAVGDLAIDDEEGNLYLALPDTGRVAVYDLLSRKRVALIEVGKGPGAITLMGGR